MTARAFLSALWILSAALLALMGWISVLHLMPGGTPLPDLWIFSYSGSDIGAYLDALGVQGINKYLGPVQALDTAFPAVLALAIGLTLLRMTARGRALPRALTLVLPLAYAMTDYVENAQIAQMMTLWPEAVPDALAQLTHRLTQAKFAVLGLCGALLLGLLLWNDAKGAR